MVWAHVYIPWKTFTIHVESCFYVSRWVKGKDKPKYQGIEELMRDGGWFSHPSLGAAEDWYRREWEHKGYTMKQECYCLSSM